MHTIRLENSTEGLSLTEERVGSQNNIKIILGNDSSTALRIVTWMASAMPQTPLNVCTMPVALCHQPAT